MDNIKELLDQFANMWKPYFEEKFKNIETKMEMKFEHTNDKIETLKTKMSHIETQHSWEIWELKKRVSILETDKEISLWRQDAKKESSTFMKWLISNTPSLLMLWAMILYLVQNFKK